MHNKLELCFETSALTFLTSWCHYESCSL